MNAAHVALGALVDSLPVIYALAALSVLCVAHKPSRRVVYATVRFTRAHAPKWLAPILAVCLAIPGPIDELAVLVIGLVIILRTSRHRHIYARYVRVAWRS